jgi:predicted lipoprotein with Yx(FWY)xxD motif
MRTWWRKAAAAPLLAAALVALAGCGDDGDSSAPATTTRPATTTTTGADGAGTTVATASNAALGEDVLVDEQGRTLYVFDNDTEPNTSACGAGCDTVWPPLTVTGTATFESGLDASMFSTFRRADGTTQVAVHGDPLYTYSGDAQPGDANGQGLGGVWWVVGTDGTKIASE